MKIDELYMYETRGKKKGTYYRCLPHARKFMGQIFPAYVLT